MYLLCCWWSVWECVMYRVLLYDVWCVICIYCVDVVDDCLFLVIWVCCCLVWRWLYMDDFWCWLVEWWCFWVLCGCCCCWLWMLMWCCLVVCVCFCSVLVVEDCWWESSWLDCWGFWWIDVVLLFFLSSVLCCDVFCGMVCVVILFVEFWCYVVGVWVFVFMFV